MNKITRMDVDVYQIIPGDMGRKLLAETVICRDAVFNSGIRVDKTIDADSLS